MPVWTFAEWIAGFDEWFGGNFQSAGKNKQVYVTQIKSLRSQRLLYSTYVRPIIGDLQYLMCQNARILPF